MADTLEQALTESALIESLGQRFSKYLVINPYLRTIIMPDGFFFGVYNDKDVLRVPFIIPRYYKDLDLSEFNIQVNFINSSGYGDVYKVDSVNEVFSSTSSGSEDSFLTFEWILGRSVFVEAGPVYFIVCFRIYDDDGYIVKELNTTIAKASVLTGLEVDENPDPVAYSILARMEAIETRANEANEILEESIEIVQNAANEAARALAQMVGAPLVAEYYDDMVDPQRVYVYTGNETGYTYGNWYYWNGSAFVSGGVYNSIAFNTDSTMTKEGSAADAKAVGDALLEKIDGARLTNDGMLYLTVGGVDKIGPIGPFASESTVVVNSLPSIPDPDLNYILKTSDGLVFYRYDDNSWKTVGGTMAIITGSLPSSGNSLADYYVRISSNVYAHYRWVNNHYVFIGPDAYSKDETNQLLNGYVKDITESESGIIVRFGNNTEKPIQTKDSTVVLMAAEPLEGNTGIRFTSTDGSTQDIGISGGGGGSGSGSATIARVTPAEAQCVFGSAFNIQYTFDAYDSSGDRVGSGEATWYVGGVRRATSTARQEVTNSFDISQYLTAGTNNIRLSISVDTGGTAPTLVTKTWTINAINLYAKWDYDDATINTASTTTLRWTPYGNLEKTTHIKVDGIERTDLQTVTSRSGVQQTVTFDRLSHGSHLVELYLTAEIDGVTVKSSSIFHDMVFVESDNTTPIIASSFTQSELTQYDSVSIPIVVYDPAGSTTTLTLEENGVVVATLTDVPRTTQYWVYTPNTAGSKTLTIRCKTVSKTFTLNVEALDIDNEEVGGYSFRLKASDLASNSALQNWSSNGVSASFSQNFDWINGGLKTELDEDDHLRQYICVKAGTRMTIGHKLFSDDPTLYGKTIKVIFKITNSRDYDADAIECFYGGIGLKMSAHGADFTSSNTSLSVQYGEDDYTELEFDIYPAPTATNGSYRYMMAWLDGVITTTRVYGASDSFTQPNANQQDIVIGSDDCDVYIYMVKAYPNYMTRENHIVNFISDAPNAQEMVKRYNRNDILDASGEIDYQKLIDNNPDCRVWLYDIPYLTVGKKDKVKNCVFNQFWKNGDQYFQISGRGTMTVQGTSSVDYIRGAANTDISFTALTDGNGDDLMVNGVVDEDNYGKNYFVGENDSVTVFTVTEGEELGSECVPVERDENGNVTKYIKALGIKINEGSTPISYSNTKVNFASCEQVNNLANAAWYQRYQPYQSLTPRDCMEFVIGVQFIKDSGTVPDNDHFVLFGDNKYHLYSIANMGTSKKNVHLFHDLTNPNECCIEVNNNLNDLCRMVTDDMSDMDWSGKIEGKDHSFGMRYPDTEDPSEAIRNGWQRFVTWMATNNPGAATGEELPTPEEYANYTFRGHDRGGTQVLRGTTVTAYAGTYTHDTFNRRMAKMLSECEDYLVMDSVVYHFVYLERHTMCDNVAKNSFWSSSDLLHWDLSKAYDMDTSDGNNNEGQMVFDYGNEADDIIGTKTVFNANDAVWFVFISNLYEACQTMFTNRETAGAWSASAYHNFLLNEQRKIPERVWNQCYWYDYLRTYEQGINDSWMTFLDGGQKTHQRWHYEYYEEIYDSSKYRGTSCTVQNVNFRGYYPSRWEGLTNEQWAALMPKAEIDLKMYNKCYINVSIDGTIYRTKADRGQTYTIDFSNQAKLNDTVINIYSAQMIQEIGDMSRLYPGTPNFANATRLRSLTVGSPTTGYRNSNLTSITFGNNKMLENLYLQNLAYVNTNLSLDNCLSLRYLDASGSSFTGYEFAEGGLLSTVYAESPAALIMKSLYYLTDANFHITSYDNLNTLVVEKCDGIDTLAIVNAANNLAIIRLISVDWVLGTTGVLNRLLGLQGRDDAGYIQTHSVLSGDAYVSGSIRNQEISNYETQWPELAVTYEPENLVTQYLITYVNADDAHTVLYSAWVDRGSTPPDPYALGLIPVPTLTSTAQYDFTFDSWDDITSIVTKNRTVTAVYTSAIRSYTVRWYDRVDGTLLKQGTYNYGSEAVYDGEWPTRTDEEEVYIVNSFKGWDKSTGYIKEDLTVYASWDRSEPPVAGTDLKDMTRGEINAVATFKMAADFLEDKDHFDMKLGYDPTFSNVSEQTLCTDRYFDGTQYLDTGLKLFDENTPSFTLAIDYEFLSTSNQNGILAGCYEEDGQEGFRLSWSGTQPYFHWGDRNLQAGYQDARNLIVFRHVGGTRRVWTYIWNTTQYYDDAITVTELIRTRETSSEQTLIFGALKYLDNGGFDLFAKGWIYWAKIWWEDLGDTICRKIAAWPRITLRMEFSGADRYRLVGQSSEKAHLSFISNSFLSLLRRFNPTNTNVGGWEDSELRGFLAGRVYDAFDYGWQSLMKNVRISASAGNKSKEIVISEDRLYLAAYQELNQSVLGTPYNEEGEPISFFTANEYRAKFSNVNIPDTAQVITEQSDPTEMQTYTVREGDLWKNTGNGSNVYIYLAQSTVAKHTRIGYRLITSTDNIAASDGGLWFRAYPWWLRSPVVTHATYFYFVSNGGGFNSYGATNTYGLVPCFSI